MNWTGRLFLSTLVALGMGFVSAKYIYAKDKKAQITSEDAYNLIDRYIDSWVAYKESPGVALGVIQDQKLVHEYYAGYADPAKKVVPNKSTMFSVCSISKLFTSIGAAKLQEDGKLNLDDAVEKHLPDFDFKNTFPTAPPMSVRNLLTHSSGLPREVGSDFWFMREGEKFPTYEDFVKGSKSLKLKTLYPAYQDLQYSNLAFSLAGEIIKRSSKQEFGDYIKSSVLNPLDMKSSAFNISEELYNSDKVAVGHSGRGRGLTQEPLSYFNTRGMAGAAGLWTNVEDLSKFLMWQFRLLDKEDWNAKEVLTKKTLKEMHRIQWVDKNLEKMWGLGFSVRKIDNNIVVGHGGHCPGYLTYAAMIPKKKLGIVLLTNTSSGAGDVEKLRGIIMQALLKVSGDLKKTSKKPKIKSNWQKHLGHYTWYPIGQELFVFPWKENLAMVEYPVKGDLGKSIRTMKHVEGDIFQVINKDDTPGLEMSFEVDKKGHTTHFINGGYRMKKL